MNILIRTLEIDDVEALYKHVNVLLSEQNGRNGFPYFSPRTALPPREEYLPKLKEDIEKHKPEDRFRLTFLALVEDKIAGHIVLEKGPLEANWHRRLINGVGVEKDYLGQGVGKALMKAGIDYAREKGIEYIDLGVFSNNTPAVSLYKKLGFEITGTTEDEFRMDGNPLDGLDMTLKL